jgi:uncharacterized protein (DUF983 family)
LADPRPESERLAWPGLRTVGRMVGRAIILRCPNCGRGSVLRNWFHLRERCPTCGIALERGEQGDYYHGGLLLNITLCFVIFALGFWGVLILTYPRVPWDALQYGLVAAMIGLPILLYHISRIVWLAVDLAIRPHSEKDPGG